jgi:hypothetical protein
MRHYGSDFSTDRDFFEVQPDKCGESKQVAAALNKQRNAELEHWRELLKAGAIKEAERSKKPVQHTKLHSFMRNI